jgi:hypothetical protein
MFRVLLLPNWKGIACLDNRQGNMNDLQSIYAFNKSKLERYCLLDNCQDNMNDLQSVYAFIICI